MNKQKKWKHENTCIPCSLKIPLDCWWWLHITDGIKKRTGEKEILSCIIVFFYIFHNEQYFIIILIEGF